MDGEGDWVPFEQTNRHTHMTETITFPQVRSWMVKIKKNILYAWFSHTSKIFVAVIKYNQLQLTFKNRFLWLTVCHITTY